MLMKHDKMAYVGSIVAFHGNPIVETKTVDAGVEQIIDTAWDNRNELSPSNAPKYLVEAVKYVVYELNVGRLRVATNEGAGEWTVHQWIKKAVLLSFRLRDNTVTRSGDLAFFDKVDTKFGHLNKDEFQNLGARVVPPAVARYGCFIAKGVVLMPSYVNIGAYVDEGTMVDTWATVGSCAQIGKNVHLSGGVGIGGVLEPLQANPTIIEDGCFIGARSEVVEGVIVREGSVLAMGCLISQSTKILNRETGEITYGSIPPYSVVVPGAMGDRVGREHSLYCVVIVKTVDAQTRAKTAINELLRF